MKKRIAVMLAALFALWLLYLLAWPTGMEPVAWTPPPAPSLSEGAYAYNEKLKGIQKLAHGVGTGPEGIYVDEFGRVLAGYQDGRLILLYDDGASYIELPNTGGRPMGITAGPKAGIVIADARKGLLYLWRKVRPLVESVGELPLRFTNDADYSRFDWEHIYFSDASSKFGYGRQTRDFLEHGANGRLLQYDVESKETRLLLGGLHFANGVAVGPDGRYVLVSETAEYRIMRYWLKGEKAGTHDVFIENLPGLPDNLSFNGRDRFWVALYAPRDARLDALLPGSTFLRHVLARLPAWSQPRLRKHAFVLALDLEGRVVANLQYAGDDAYAPITSVRESGPWLYFGSLTYPAIGRIALAQAVPGSPPPPASSDPVPVAREKPNPLSQQERNEDEEEERESPGR